MRIEFEKNSASLVEAGVASRTRGVDGREPPPLDSGLRFVRVASFPSLVKLIGRGTGDGGSRRAAVV